MQKIKQHIEDYLKREWKDEPTGHDWEHVRRVRDVALEIHKVEGGNRDIIELGALLHDISDHKFNGGNIEEGGKKAKSWLMELGAHENDANSVKKIVDNVSFKGANVDKEEISLETQIVQDADRLDAIGAIGIARAFAFGGNRNQTIYQSDLAPKLHNTFEEYANSKTTSINHFYEKLLLLKDKMNTQEGKKIAEQRHQFMSDFLDQFFLEWNYSNKKNA